jgi:predicted lipoprotein with Yx(FWY)xxD motif
MIGRRLRVAIGTAAALAVVLGGGTPAAYAHGTHGFGAGYGAGEAAIVSLESSPYGPVLVVGGPGAGVVPGNPGASAPTPPTYVFPAGSSLYIPTIDPPAPKGFGAPYQAGCLTTEVPGTAFGTVSCTGLETDEHADWPALTTARKPIAGPGVDPHLLGSVFRADLGTFQVTYARHPLYLFNPGADSFAGQKLPETVLPLPPWHTYWFLLSPDGLPATGPAHIETEAPQPGTTYSSTVLAAEMAPEFAPGGVVVSVYSFSRDSHGHSRCAGPCARDFIPVLTDGAPTAGAGANAGELGEIVRHSGSHQVTYDGHPLYLYSQEQPLVGAMGLIATGTAGNGNGVHAFGGTFSLLSP